MTKQVLSIEQMLNLQKLGIDTSNASASWYRAEPFEYFQLMPFRYHKEELVWSEESISAFTLQDILDILPTELKPAKTRYWLRIDLYDECIYYYCEDCNLVENRKKVIAYDGISGLIDAAYEMLLWCIQNEYVNPGKEERQ